MKINRDQFLAEGYIILPQVIPPDQLNDIRTAYELLVERQKQRWAQQAGPDDPPGGVWELAGQPRLHIHGMADQIDAQTAAAIEIWLHPNIHQVSSQLLRVEDAGVTEMMLMCSPVRDHGPAKWHRDFYPPYCAPLQSYAEDILENGPRYVQWNIPLYDDDVLWVVPGSHVRSNTPEENRQLEIDNRQPLNNGVQTHLKAGDGVAYILPLLHWGSNYSTKMRRTIHGGFSTFTRYADLSYLKFLSPSARASFERWETRSQAMLDRTEAALRAVIAQDATAYCAALDRLHPSRGPKGQRQTTIFLSKTAKRINDLKRPDFDTLPQARQNYATSFHPMTMQWGQPLADRFSPAEAQTLWQRFEPVDSGLQTPTKQSGPGYQGGPTHYWLDRVPEEINLQNFVAGWGA